MTRSVGTVTFTVSPPVSSGTPAWFASLQPMTWLNIADGTGSTGTGGARLDQVTYTSSHVWPTGYVGKPGSWRSPDNYCKNTNGAAIDAVNGEMLLVANGGHSGYQGNETMRLKLRQATPAWDRMIEATPPDYTAQSSASAPPVDGSYHEHITLGFESLSYHGYTDGPVNTYPTSAASSVNRRPMTMHTSAIPTYSNGKVWFPCMSSTPGGRSCLTKLAMNIQAVRDNPLLAQWEYGRLSPWEYLGVAGEAGALGQSAFIMGTSGLDAVTGRVWYASTFSNSFWFLETQGVNAGRHQMFDSSPAITTEQACGGAITTGLLDVNGNPVTLFIVYGRRQYNRDVYVLNITGLQADHPSVPYGGTPLPTSRWVKYTATDAESMLWINQERFIGNSSDPAGLWGPQQGWGCVYHEPSKALLMFNCDHAVNNSRVRDGQLRKLVLPINGQGRYDPSLPWTYRRVSVGGPVPASCDPTGLVTGGSFSRFNVIRQFDGTNDLLISLNAYDAATSVMKLPPQAV